MSSIPLPALGIRPPQQQNPLEGAEKLMAMKSLIQGQQAQQQEIQIRQQQINDMNTVRELSQSGKYVKKDDSGNPSGFDYDRFFNDASARGVSMQTLSQMQTFRKNAADTVLAEQQGQEKYHENQQKHIAQGYQYLEGIRGEKDPEQRQARYEEALNYGRTNNIQGIDKLPQQVPDDAGLNGIEMALGMHAQALADTKTQQEISTSQATEREKTASATAKEAETQFYKNNAILGAPGVPAETVSMRDWLAKNPGKGPSDYQIAMKKIVPAYNFQLQNAGATGQGGQPSVMAQAIASGQMNWKDAVSPRTPMAVKEGLLKEVKQINPNFNSGDFDVEKRVKEAFTSGDYSKKLNAIATAREHMKTFGDLAERLDNGPIRLFNDLGNRIGIQFGDDRATNLNIAKQFFAGEVGQAVVQGQGTEGERSQLAGAISTASSWKQLAGALKTADALLAGKQKALQETYASGQQAKPNFGEQPEAPGGFWDQFPEHK